MGAKKVDTPLYSPNDEEFQSVCDVFEEYAGNLAEMMLPNKHVFAVDVNGTLDAHPLVDLFFSDLHDRGLPVSIMSARTDNDLSSYRLAKRLAGDDMASLKPDGYKNAFWFIQKALDQSTMPGFVVDDDRFLPLLVDRHKGKGIRAVPNHPKDSEESLSMKFFEIWAVLSPEQKDAAVKPYVDSLKRCSAESQLSAQHTKPAI